MNEMALWPWAGLVLLGAWHGINPGMGWLFAVALGLQGQGRRGVWRALPPLALGHGLAIGVAVLFAALLGLVVPVAAVKWLVAGVLLGFGLWRLVRSRHPRFGGMQVGSRDLALWSFLMASAHGAGLMALPFVLTIGSPPAAAHHAGHAGHPHAAQAVGLLLTAVSPEWQPIAATAAHTAGYLLAMAGVAVIVYEHLGLTRLRSLWLNLDLVWAAALILTALLTPFV